MVSNASDFLDLAFIPMNNNQFWRLFIGINVEEFYYKEILL